MKLRSVGLVCITLLVVIAVGCGGASTNPTPPVTLSITTSPTLTAGTVGVAYSLTLGATGGSAPYAWSLTGGTLPAGLTLSGSTISGTPTTAGSSSFSVTVKDSKSNTATLAATLVVSASKLAITTTSPLTPGIVGTVYSLTLAATGGTGADTWTVTAGALPAGLSLTTAGVLSGTPTTPGTSTFTVQATDSGSPAQTATLAATLVVSPATLAIVTTSPLTPATAGSAYSLTFVAAGGTGADTWAVTTGTLPAGLTLTPAGVLSGTPTTAGTSTFTVQATDSGSPAQTAALAATLVVSPNPVSVTTTSLPTGYSGSAYVDQLAVTGGTAPYTWSVASGTLPAGIVLSKGGMLSGTPGSVSTTSLTFTVSDSAGHTAVSSAITLTINAASGTVPDNFYVFVFAGTAPQGTPPVTNGIAINGTIKIKTGQVVSGFYDQNNNTTSPTLKAPISGGTLTLGANGLGQLVLTTATGTMTFALASPASVSTGGLTPIRMIEYDDATGSGSRGSGVIDPTPPNPTSAAISGNFAFLLSGTDVDQNQQALVGAFQTDGAGNVTGGTADANQVIPVGGVPTRGPASFNPIKGTYTVDSDGRGVLKLILDGGTFSYSFYEVSPQEWLVISLDPASLNSPLVSGFAYQQTGGPFTTASIPATSVLEVEGVTPASTTSTPMTPPVPDVSVGLVSSDGAGKLTFTYDEYGGALPSGSLSDTYAVDPVTGRTATTPITATTTQPLLYLISNTSAFYLGSGPSGQSGMIEAQAAGPFSTTSFSGNYLGGSLPLVLTSVLNESGLVVSDGAGNVTFTTNRSNDAGLVYQSDVVVGTYTVDATGRGVITAPDGFTRIFYVVNAGKIAYLTGDSGGYLGSFQQ